MNGYIYLGNNDFGFAEYSTFTRGLQDADTFVRGGLAKILEHTSEEVAKSLRGIFDEKNYPHGVDVLNFDPVKYPILNVAGLGSSIRGGGLDVDRY